MFSRSQVSVLLVVFFSPRQGHLLGHVYDMGLDRTNPNHRVYATSAAQPFHTDSVDIVGLLCLREAMEGGARP